MGQLANAIGLKGQGNLPSNIETNLREVKAIALQSGKKLKTKAEMDIKAKTNEEDDQYMMVEDISKEKVIISTKNNVISCLRN